MLPSKEIGKFLLKRFNRDSYYTFLWRLCRLAFILPFSLYEAVKYRLTMLLLGENNPYILRTIQKNYMLLDRYDSGISRDLLADTVREPYLTQMIHEEIKFGDVVFDIGANIGYYTLQEARKVGEKGLVLAIEPAKMNCDLLQKNIELNKLLNVFPQRYNIEVMQCAIGNEDKKVNINISSLRNLCSISETRDVKKVEEVEMLTLDTLIEKVKAYPDAIRMDVEGFEYEIIKGMKKLLGQTEKHLKIFMELHCDILLEKQAEMCEMLKYTGFTVKKASFEPHPSVQRHKWALPLLRFLDTRLGAKSGFVDVTIDDLISNKKYTNGNVEYLEVLFER